MSLNLSEWALKNRSLTIYFMAASVIAGVLTYLSLGRNEDPPFTFRTMVVAASWPGASLDETIKQVTERIERKIQETPYLDYVESYTKAGTTTIFVHLKGETPPREVPDIWYHVRKSVGDIRHTLPQGVVGPGFNDEFGDTYGIIFGFTADGFSHRELRDYVEEVRSELLHVKDVSKIELLGEQDERVFIEFSTEKLAGLGVDRSALAAALAAQNIVSPAGTIQTGDESLVLRTTGAFNSERDLADVTFVVNGRLIRLRDIATVRRELADPPEPIFRVNGTPGIGLAIAMRDGGDILVLGRNIDKAMKEIKAKLPLGIEAFQVANQPQTVNLAINEFTTSLWQAIAICMAVSVIALGLRAGTVVALSIPLTLAILFPIMKATGIDLQRISLGALIIALGLLVDSAMAAVDTMSTRIAQGDTKENAAAYAYKVLAMPMLTGSFVTAAGFVPIGFAKSSAGEYTFSIFAVVGLSLIVSWFVAVIFTPLHAVWLLKTPEKADKDQKQQEPGLLLRSFRSLLVGAMRWRWLTIAITLGAFAGAFLLLPFVSRQFFPPSDRPELMVDISLPQNASIYASRDASAKLEELLKGDPDVESWSTYVGRGAIRFYLPLNVQLRNDFFSQAVVIAKNLESRDRLQKKLEAILPEKFPSAVTRVSPLELGPPVGWPVQYRVSGPDKEEVRKIALRLAPVIASNPTVKDVNFDWIEPGREIRIRIDQDEARLLGLSTASIAAALNSVFKGVPVTQLRDDIYLIDVITRATDEQRVSLPRLRTLQIPLPRGGVIPLSQIATFEAEQEYPVVWRRDRVPTLTVQADMRAGQLPETAVTQLTPLISEINASLPRGYNIAVGGTVEESQKSQASVIAVVPAMLFLMITFLMIQLKSFSLLAIVLSVVPMGLIGIILALLLVGKPLGFVAILGTLALLGLIARNAIILIEQVIIERREGKNPWDAVVDASLSRFRPIVLTAVSTVLGLIPIAPTVFWGPMAYAMMGGLLVATALTLIFLPALYVAWFRIQGPSPAREAKPLDGKPLSA